VDFAQLVKLYGPTITAPGRYNPAQCIGARKQRVEGNPDIAHVSTSYVGRQNLTMRMSTRRFTRLANAFSKKLDNRIHKTPRMSHAMAAGVTDRLKSLEAVVAKIDELAPVPKARGPYRKRGMAQ